MSLRRAQCKHLRRLGCALKPVVLIGAGGLSESVLAELDNALAHHELIKVRVRVGDRGRRDEVLAQLVTRSGATLVQRIGNVALLYRAAEEPKIHLP